jgi:hypothetical protein
MKLLAASDIDSVVGKVTLPATGYKNIAGGGLILFFSNVLRLVFVVAGIYAFINFIIAGYGYMSAGGDSKAIAAAWARIWQSLMGLVIIVGSFAFAALLGQVLFGDPTYILSPTIYGPGT